MQEAGYTERQREYREVYLRSAHWAETREAALERAEHRCQVCNGGDRLDVHHRTYERLGAEEPADLTVLCRRCHELFHSTAKVAAGKNRKSTTGGGRRAIGSPTFLRSDYRELLLNALGHTGRLTSKQIAQHIGWSAAAVGKNMVTLRHLGLVTRNGSRWKTTPQGQAELSRDVPVAPPQRPLPRRKNHKRHPSVRVIYADGREEIVKPKDISRKAA
jgi:biotin operon repressor